MRLNVNRNGVSKRVDIKNGYGNVWSVSDAQSLNAVAVDRVELRAKMIYDKFDNKHDETKVGNAAIVSDNPYTVMELQKLLRNTEKNKLLNDLEALKAYKENKELKLK